MNALPLRLAVQYARRRPARSFATVVGVMAGVAGLRAIDLGTRGALTSVQDAYQEEAGPAALTVTPAGDTRAPLPPGITERLVGHGIEAVLPMVQATTVRAEELNPWAAPLMPGEVNGVVVLGVDFAREQGRGRWRVIGGDTNEPGTVLVGSTWAGQRNLKPGGMLKLVAGDGVARFKIGGLIAREGLGEKNYGQVVIAPIDEVRQAFGLKPDEVQEAALVLVATARPETLAIKLHRELGDGVSVVAPQERGQDVAQRLGNIRAGTDLVSSIALFLSAFLIYGLFATAAAERRRDLGMLRSLGATPFQSVLPLLVEAMLLAVPGAIAGAGLGAVLAKGVALTMGKMAGAELHVPPPDLGGAIRAGVIGLAVALAASAWPAIRAARQDAVDAMRALGGAAEPPRWRTTLIWGAVLLVTAILLGTHPPRVTHPGLTYALVLSLLASCTGLLPVIIGPLAGYLAKHVAWVDGAVSLGVAAPRWRPGRSGLAAGAVLGSVAMVGGISALGGGMRVEMSDWADHALSWDLFVRRPSGLDSATVARVHAQPGVLRASEAVIRPVELSTADGRTLHLSLIGLDTQAYAAEESFVFAANTKGDRAAITRALGNGTTAFAPGVVAGQFGLKQGTTVTVQTPTGPRSLVISAEIVDYTQNGFALVVDSRLLKEAFHVEGADLVAVRLAPGASADEVVAALEALPGVKVERRTEMKARVMKLVDESMQSMDGLLWLSILIGLLAVGASVAQGAIERRADIAALRGLGMTGPQVSAMLVSEAVMTALVGAVTGGVLGLYLGWVFAESTHTLGIPIPYVAPWRVLILAMAGVVLAAIPAAWFPARTASSISPGEALRVDG